MDTDIADSKSEDNKDILPGFTTLDSYLQAAYPLVAEGIKASNSLPNPKEFGYYRTYPQFVNIMKTDGFRLQQLMDCLLRRNGLRKANEDINSIIDSNDRSLDRVNCNLLEMDGRKRNPLTIKPPVNQVKVPSGGWHDRQTPSQPSKDEVVLCVSTGTIRPQVLFKDKIDNSNSPWIPRIKEKPNSLKPLSILLEINEQGQECYSHPYDYELTLWKPRDDQLCPVTEKEPLLLSDTPYVYVETEEQLNEMLSDLLKTDEIAVDLEHHSYRSFMGFTCLMQISTWEKDYVIDTLTLRDKLHVLNEVFTKPTILKVFHGADSDIEWLQRDLSLYVVNMFDTYQASKLLGFYKLSLAHLLQKYCKIEANKEYQLFDWRRRPLPESALKYAREDTHYLLYIYQKMRNALIENANGKSNLLEAVYDRSRETCKKVYTKPLLEDDSHMTIYRRQKLNFDNRQLYALREIYRWRDRIARQEDESTGYVLPNHMMVQICRTLPREMQGILACCNPIPPLVRTFLLELHMIILRAKEQPLVKSLADETRINSEDGAGKEHRLIFPQDNAGLEFRDDLPTLLGGNIPEIPLPQKPTPIITAFEEPDDTKKCIKVGKVKFVSPYQRYLKVLPYAIQLEKEERERREKEEEERLSNATNALELNSSKDIEEQVVEVPAVQPLAKDRSYVKKARRERGDVSVKTEKSPHSNHASERSGGIGVVGGEVRVAVDSVRTFNDKNSQRGNNRKQEVDESGWTKSEHGNYDYTKVDFQKFQSGAGGKKKGYNPRFQNKRKKKGFQDRVGNKKPRNGVRPS